MVYFDASRQEAIRSDFADDPTFQELLELFAEAIPERRASLLRFYEEGQLDQLRIVAHQLKGAGGGYGFGGLSALAAELEQACRTRDPQRIRETLEELVDYIDRIEVD